MMDLRGSSGSMMTSGLTASSSIWQSFGCLLIWSHAVCVKCSFYEVFVPGQPCLSKDFPACVANIDCWKNDLSWTPAFPDVSVDCSSFYRSENICKTAKRRCRILSVCTSVTSTCAAVLSSAQSKFTSNVFACVSDSCTCSSFSSSISCSTWVHGAMSCPSPAHSSKPSSSGMYVAPPVPWFSSSCPQVLLTAPQPPEERMEV